MTYDAKEKSTYGGNPIELYIFTRGADRWSLTNGDTDIFVGAETFSTGWPLTRTEPELSQDAQHSDLKISTSMEMPVAWLFRGGSPWEPIWVTVMRKHRDDSEAVAVWQGKIQTVHFQASKGVAEITCSPIDKVLGKGGFRQGCGPQCNKQLYSTRCAVNEATHTVYGTITGIDPTGYVVTSAIFATKPDNYFKLGELYVQLLEAKVQIVAHMGSNMTLKRPVNDLALGMLVRACAGCDHVWKRGDSSDGDCIAKFNNAVNYLGFPFVPTKNPYEVGLEG